MTNIDALRYSSRFLRPQAWAVAGLAFFLGGCDAPAPQAANPAAQPVAAQPSAAQPMAAQPAAVQPTATASAPPAADPSLPAGTVSPDGIADVTRFKNQCEAFNLEVAHATEAIGRRLQYIGVTAKNAADSAEITVPYFEKAVADMTNTIKTRKKSIDTEKFKIPSTPGVVGYHAAAIKWLDEHQRRLDTHLAPCAAMFRDASLTKEEKLAKFDAALAIAATEEMPLDQELQAARTACESEIMAMFARRRR